MICTREDCPYKDDIADHEQRIRDCENVKLDIVAIKKDVGYIKEILDPLIIAVKELTDKPAKRWEMIVGLLTGGGVTYLIAQIIS